MTVELDSVAANAPNNAEGATVGRRSTQSTPHTPLVTSRASNTQRHEMSEKRVA